MRARKSQLIGQYDRFYRDIKEKIITLFDEFITLRSIELYQNRIYYRKK
jgi:hypothetical protein